MAPLSGAIMRALARRGFAVQRHPAWRRQAMLAKHRIDLVLDVGAARGGFGTELRRFGYAGRIVSFEPLSAAFAGLAAASADDPKWTAVNTALGSIPGPQVMNVASNSDSSSLLDMNRKHLSAAPHVQVVRQEEIQISRLDDVASDHAGERPFLKIDAQGFEHEVLAGAERTLATCVGLQLELSFVPLYDGEMLVDEAVTLAYQHGFHLVGVYHGFSTPDGAMLQADGIFFRD